MLSSHLHLLRLMFENKICGVAQLDFRPKCNGDFSARSYLVCVVLAVITATTATTCFLLLSLSQVMMVQNKLYNGSS